MGQKTKAVKASAKRTRRSASRSRRGRNKNRSGAGVRLGLILALFPGVVASGTQVVFTAHQLREIHGLLEATRHRQDRLLAEHSRLLLERGAVAAYQHVERVAEVQLNMRFPNEVERVLP